MDYFMNLEDKLNTNVVEELKYSINNQKNIKQKLSLLNNKDEVINYISKCQKNINEIIFISTCQIQDKNNYQIQDIIKYSLDHIFPFIQFYINNYIDTVYVNNNKDVITNIDIIFTDLLYYFENDIIFNNIHGNEYYLSCFNIYINLLQIGYLLTKKESYISICTDFSNI